MRRGLSASQGQTPETNPASTLTLDLQPPELCKNKLLVCKPTSLVFGMAVLAN